jgi:NitT/TauT family transport system ATP-binding protein
MGAELNGKQLQEAENDAAVKVKVSGLSKYFPVRKKKGIGAGEFCAIKDLNLEIRTGEFLTVVGPSGCGKSTFLEIMAGLSKPSTGTILIDGKKVTGPAMDRGVVFQGYALLPWRTVRGNVEYGLEIKKIPPKERHEISSTYIKMVGLENFADNYPHELSGGMRQRVAIARTLAFNPEEIGRASCRERV